jgi:hypothetical protein
MQLTAHGQSGAPHLLSISMPSRELNPLDSPIAITLLSTTPALTFRLATGEGGTPHVAQFIVSDVLTRRPVWWIVSRPWADAVSFRPMWIDFLPYSGSQLHGDSDSNNELDSIRGLAALGPSPSGCPPRTGRSN